MSPCEQGSARAPLSEALDSFAENRQVLNVQLLYVPRVTAV